MVERASPEPGLLGELVRRLDLAGGRSAYHPEESVLVISRWRDEPLDPPVRLAVDEDVLERHLPLLYEDAATLWPDIGREAGAFNLLSVHLDETVRTRKPGHKHLVLDPGTRLPEWVAPPS
ncbi:hypothetical protein [Actinophytocola xanthii]|uniref:Uncharacterized protein n=1 Tax=Actinophytocola xanthii TaxID=1912961 RepID=A0A1Q8C6F9_9PSEU|nr:hypothetical protein [Actinophytocola xanthii]OLF09933.1 hypothetical protein BU204_32480 [Actinophytocola xanthii]